MNAGLILIISTCVFLALGVPVAFALGLATAAALILAENFPLLVLLKETFTGIDSFPLMAVPFFILAAELMSGGSLTDVLLRFAGQFVGHKRGGLGYTNVVSLTFFSGISGSALADAAGPGSMLIRMMDKAGYDRSYAAALPAATAIVGPIIPPSIIMIIYALQDDNVSVGALFVAGLLPGILIAVAMCLVNFHVSKKRNYRGDEGMPPWPEVWRTTWKAIPALLLPVIILGGMRAGWFTPTEASVVAVFYALICGKFVYRTLEWKALPDILSRSALMTASVLVIIGMSASRCGLDEKQTGSALGALDTRSMRIAGLDVSSTTNSGAAVRVTPEQAPADARSAADRTMCSRPATQRRRPHAGRSNGMSAVRTSTPPFTPPYPLSRRVVANMPCSRRRQAASR